MPARVAGYAGRFDAFGWHLIGQVRRQRGALPHRRPTLVDLGMGRGRDVLYLGRHGFRVLGVDLDPVGLERARRRAARMRVPITTDLRDLGTWRLPRRFDVVFSSTFLNYLAPERRPGRLAHFQAATVPGGLHAVNALIAPPPFGSVPDLEGDLWPFRRGELRRYYRRWEILESGEQTLDCRFGGPDHRHTVESVVARKPTKATRPPAPGP
jgi:hypothetical protein